MQADASKLGMGATFHNNWLQLPFLIFCQSKNITFLVFFPILLLVQIFHPALKNSTILFKSDNQAVCHIISKLSSKDQEIMFLVRKLVILLTCHNIDLRSEHVPGKLNVICDKLSRFQETPSLLRAHRLSPLPVQVPPEFRPENLLI